MKTHQVIHDGGAQSITAVPVDEAGEVKAPSSATYAIYNLRFHEDSSDRTVVASTAATVDSTSTTTDASSGRGTANPRRVQLTSAAGFAEGSTYLITNTDGRSEAFVADHIDTGNADVYAEHELSALYASGSTVVGVEVSGTFPALEAADDTEFDGDNFYAVDWVFAGVTPSRRRDLIKVRRTAERVYASVEDIKTLDATLAPYSDDRLDLARCLVQAHRDFRRGLRKSDVDPDTYNGGETARDAVTYRAAELARRQMGGERDERLADEYAAQFANIMSGLGGVGEVLTDRQGDDERFDLAEKLDRFALT